MKNKRRDYTAKIEYWNNRLADAQTTEEIMKCNDKLEYFEGRQKQLEQGPVVTEFLKLMEQDMLKATRKQEAFEEMQKAGCNVTEQLAFVKGSINRMCITFYDIKEIIHQMKNK